MDGQNQGQGQGQGHGPILPRGETEAKPPHTGVYTSPPQFKDRPVTVTGFKPPPPPLPPNAITQREDNSNDNMKRNHRDNYQENSKENGKDRRKNYSRENPTENTRDNRRESNREERKRSNSSLESKYGPGPGSDPIIVKKNKVSEELEEKKPEIKEEIIAVIVEDVQIKEEYVPLKWALEDSSVLVSRRLAGNELYERVLALRGTDTKNITLKEENTENEMKKSRDENDLNGSQDDNQIKSEGDSESKGGEGISTLDEMLASITQSGAGSDSEAAAVSIDDFFGAFSGTVSRVEKKEVLL